MMSVASIGAGLVALGAGVGIGILWGMGVAAIARQPELTSKIQVNLFIGAALIEGIALFAMVICFMSMGK